MDGHYSVMTSECLEMLAVQPDGWYVDVTCGQGGHSAAIASRLTTGRLIARDRDAEAVEATRRATAEWADRILYQQGRFSDLREGLLAAGTGRVQGCLADLGVSRVQLTSGERGFSFQQDGPLDMRMDRTQELSAAEIVNFSSEKELAELFERLGEERRDRSRKAARAIVRARPVRTTGQLARVLESVLPRTGRLHVGTQIFMGLRLAVNNELDELDALLESLPDVVAPGGRVVVLTFMSLEDRKVKHAFQALARNGRARLLTKHVVRPAEAEVLANAASRSAKLRAIEMC